MATVAVNRLTLVTPPGRRAEAQARAEDALRLAGLVDDRLLVIRRLDFGAFPPAARPSAWQARADGELRALAARAVHGSHPGATASDAVWFVSVDEARSLLLLILARGVIPVGWFWRLAVRGWHGAPLTVWLPLHFSEIRDNPPAIIALAKAVTRALATGRGEAMCAALCGLPEAPGRRVVERFQLAADVAENGTRQDAETGPAITRIIARHDTATIAALKDAMQRPDFPLSARRWLARFALLAAAPELEAQTARVDHLADVLSHPQDWAEAPSLQPLLDMPDDEARGETLLHDWDEVAADQREGTVDGTSGELRPTGAADQASVGTVSAEPAVPPPHQPSPARETPVIREHQSEAAGLWLLIRPLWTMGLAKWLEVHRELAVDGFGTALMVEIANRHRVCEDDPVLFPLSHASGKIPPQILDAWRVGLDRWLRRRTGLRLCDVVNKRGWINIDEHQITIRFCPDDAEIALRRRALDLDPGWVPWLGMVVRYAYRDGTLP